MTEAQPAFDSHPITPVDTFRNNFIIDQNKDPVVTSSTIADHINYQLSQMDPTYTLENTNMMTDSPVASFIKNHTSSQDLIDKSNINSVERVLEWSPNKRYYRLNTLLGKGAFKVVHKAMDLEEGYEVAWNVLHIGHDNNKDVRHEIEILKSVRHPNIIAFHDAWVSENRTEFIFVTELMTSGTLREYIRKLNLPNQKIVKRWCRQILKGLAYLHGHNPPIIHRDIKCDNIFINGAHGEIKIGDLGTAENMWLGDKKYTVIGTPEFMAPEMYEEEGYNEKVDLYAFGMCLIEMTTGEYPYSECTNTAQIYKKVCQHIKPESLAKIHDQQVLEVINSCLSTNENERLSAQELLECSFLAVEPDVMILENDPSHTIITLQVVFKGSDKLSVKFEFNTQEDTAEEVVAEMIEEQVLPDRYQQWITNEINRILRDLDKSESDVEKYNSQQSVWRRENDIRSELEKSKLELTSLIDKAAEIEKKCELLKQKAIMAEEREKQVLLELEKAVAHKIQNPEETLSDEGDIILSSELHKLSTKDYSDDTSIDTFVYDTAKATNRDLSKADEWLQRLKDQDIMTVGDLRELLDEDWSGIGLTVFAIRALKNMLRNRNSEGANNNHEASQ
ncbi:Serine/threonine-protein kinase pkpA [Choanephora cucurbitarum]|uniref:Serine/threonine-protein kinase pkpA n=1 Tax=Choanephora cucurbitarum TaxID=101091 RepID=A0A1C7N505_9FUNG|nr:Serine/threonine-protein kinase pkpA [Choanephora cucurbitarum]